MGATPHPTRADACRPDRQAAGRTPEIQPPVQTLDTTRAQRPFSLADFRELKAAIEAQGQPLTSRQILRYLDLSGWDTGVFVLLRQEIAQGIPSQGATDQSAWARALCSIWANRTPGAGDFELAAELGRLAASMHRWADAIWFFEQALQTDTRRPDPPPDADTGRGMTMYNLAISHWQHTRLDQAEACLTQAHALFDGDAGKSAQTTRQMARLAHWRHTCERRTGAVRIAVRPDQVADSAPQVYGTLLGPHHAQALFRHQSDVDLAERAGVEPLKDMRHASDWIARHSARTQTMMAIMHPECGLIGVAGLERPGTGQTGDTAALFFFWVAAGFQNQGHGKTAMALVHQMARNIGIRQLLSLVRRENQPSHRVLSQLGYHHVAYAQPGDGPPTDLFYLSLDADEGPDPNSALATYDQVSNALDNGEDTSIDTR